MFIVRAKHDGSLYETSDIQSSRVLQSREYVCPICGEIVVPVRYMGEPFHHFKHMKSTDFTPFCENRVSNFSISKFKRIDDRTIKIMIRGGEGKYELIALFPSISEKYSKYGSSYLKIGPASNIKSYKISRFIGQKTPVILNFIPDKENSQIRLEGILSSLYSDIERKIDPFFNGCALFDSDSMRKVPENGAVYSTYKYELIISDDSVSIPSSFNPQFFGELTIESIPIYSITIPESCNQEAISFLRYCGVCLEDPLTRPEILWPPMSSVNGILETYVDTDVIFKLDSSGTEAWEDHTGSDLDSYGPYKVGTILGDETTFSFRSGNVIYSFCCSTVRSASCDIQSRSVRIECVGDTYQVKANFKGYVLMLFRSFIKCYKQNNEVSELKEPFETLIYLDENTKECFKTTTNTESKLERVVPSRFDCTSGRMVPLPVWFRCAILALGEKYPTHARMILNAASGGFVSESVVQKLQQWR